MNYKKILGIATLAVSSMAIGIIPTVVAQEKEYTVDDYMELVDTINAENSDCFYMDVADYSYFMERYTYEEFKDTLDEMAAEQRRLTYGIRE
nr:hypothetical protein [uncultured Cellulosilyticum sp.]